ncbi:MAG: hypothetical protein ABIO84_01500 [Lysobacter sp.]
MNNHPSAGAPDGDDAAAEMRFDQTVRRLHADALSTVSPLVRSRLQQVRGAATLARRERRNGAWTWAGSAAVLALVLGVGLQFDRSPVRTPDAPLSAAPVTDVEVSNLLAALDENPDFYLWLASNEDALSHSTERYP